MVLSLLISGFAFTMHVETQVASFARKELKAEMLARSGIEVARMQLILHQQTSTDAAFDALNQDWATNELLYVDHELGDGIYNVKITDEESKIPINRATDLQLKRLLDLLGVDPFDGDVIVDSILDWIDADDLTKLNGAESDYYQSLSPPYRAKNAPMDRVEELLLVRGVTPELYHGTPTEDAGGASVFSGAIHHHVLGPCQREHGLQHRVAGDAQSRRPTGASHCSAGAMDRTAFRVRRTTSRFKVSTDLSQWIGGLGATQCGRISWTSLFIFYGEIHGRSRRREAHAHRHTSPRRHERRTSRRWPGARCEAAHEIAF